MPITKKQELSNVPISKLIPYAKNPRKNDAAVKQVAASLKEFGLVKNSIVVDEDMVLITGHTTTKAMQSLGWETAPDVTQVFGLTAAQKKAYRIADNKLGELADWDTELLGLELEELRDADFDIGLTGFDDIQLDEMFPPEMKEAHDNSFEVAKEDNYEQNQNISTGIKFGDIIQLGRHKLLCGDSSDSSAILKLLEGKSVDLLFYDPPYENPKLWDCYIDADKSLIISDARHIKDAMLIGNKYDYIYEFIWDTVMSWYLTNRPLCRHRSALLCQNTPDYNSNAMVINDGKKRKSAIANANFGEYTYQPLDDGDVRLTTVYKKNRFEIPEKYGKPIEWIAPIIAGTGAKLILDLFGGSGSTLMACDQVGATCYIVEIDPIKCQHISDRYNSKDNYK